MNHKESCVTKIALFGTERVYLFSLNVEEENTNILFSNNCNKIVDVRNAEERKAYVEKICSKFNDTKLWRQPPYRTQTFYLEQMI